MLFTVINTDRAGQLDLRMATRTDHLAFLDSEMARIINGGAMLDTDGKPCGSVLIIEAADLAEAEAFAAADPYAKAGLFASSVVCRYNGVFKDGKRA
jgi:uncharacterized protein YciI